LAFRRSHGQASLLLVAGLGGILIAAVIAGVVAGAVGQEGGAQRAADLAAVAAARTMHSDYGGLFEPATERGKPDRLHLEKADYLAAGRETAQSVAHANGAPTPDVSFPDEDTLAPVRVRVTIHETVHVAKRTAAVVASAEAELAPADLSGFATGDGYD